MATNETYHWLSMLFPMPWETSIECMGRILAVKEALEAANRSDWQRWIDECTIASSRLMKAEDIVANMSNLTRALHPRVGHAPRSAVSDAMWRAWTYSRDPTDDEIHEHGKRSFLVGRLVDYALAGRPTHFHIIRTALGFWRRTLPRLATDLLWYTLAGLQAEREAVLSLMGGPQGVRASLMRSIPSLGDTWARNADFEGVWDEIHGWVAHGRVTEEPQPEETRATAPPLVPALPPAPARQAPQAGRPPITGP